MTDDRDDAEFLDGDVLGEEVGDDAMPGEAQFPPDMALGVDDPSLDVDDDVATRDLRADASEAGTEPAIALVDDGAPDGLADDEAQEIATAVDITDGDIAPEESALHIVDAPDA